MSQIVVDIKAGSVTVDDYIRLHAATDFIIRGVAQESMALSISTHQGICLFRITNFTRGDDELSARVTLESDGLVAAFRHVPPLGSRKFILSIHSRNASFSILFSEELVIWNDIAHSTDMGDYALKSEIPDVSGFVTADYLNAYVLKRELPDFDIYVKTSDLSKYALKSEIPEINLSGYALKSELFSKKYEDLSGTPDLTVYVKSSELSKYALKSELPESVDLSRYLLKTEAFSGRYSDLAGVPDLSQYALKSELPDGVDLSLYQLKADAFGGSYSELTGKPDLTVYAKNADLSRYALKSEIPASADLSLYQLKADAFSKKYEDLTGAPDLSVYAKKSELFNTPVTLSDNLNAVIPPNGKVTPFLQHDTTTGLYELRVRLPGGSTASVSQSAPDMSLYLTVASAAETYAAKGHVHTGVYAPLENGKIPSAYLPEGSGGGGAEAKAATISLPVPFDDDNDNVSLYLDIGTDPEFAENTYTRIRMTDHYAKMKIFANETFRTMTEGFCGVPEYGATVSFTLDTEMMPGYVPGTVYYARYTWMDSKGAHDGWHGFIFSGDVADMEPIRTLYENPPKVKAESAAAGSLSLDYLEGEIQNYTMSANVTVDLANVANVPFGEALICNIKRTGGTLSVVNGNSTQTYTENKTYMIVVTNFGTPMIAVTETI